MSSQPQFNNMLGQKYISQFTSSRSLRSLSLRQSSSLPLRHCKPQLIIRVACVSQDKPGIDDDGLNVDRPTAADEVTYQLLDSSSSPSTSSSNEFQYDEETKTMKVSLSALEGEGAIRRTRLVTFTCNKCGGRTTRAVNPVAWEKGLVMGQCGECKVWHVLSAKNKDIYEEINFKDQDLASP